MHFLQAINSDTSVLIVCNNTGGTIKGDKKYFIQEKFDSFPNLWVVQLSHCFTQTNQYPY